MSSCLARIRRTEDGITAVYTRGDKLLTFATAFSVRFPPRTRPSLRMCAGVQPNVRPRLTVVTDAIEQKLKPAGDGRGRLRARHVVQHLVLPLHCTQHCIQHSVDAPAPRLDLRSIPSYSSTSSCIHSILSSHIAFDHCRSRACATIGFRSPSMRFSEASSDRENAR